MSCGFDRQRDRLAPKRRQYEWECPLVATARQAGQGFLPRIFVGILELPGERVTDLRGVHVERPPEAEQRPVAHVAALITTEREQRRHDAPPISRVDYLQRRVTPACDAWERGRHSLTHTSIRTRDVCEDGIEALRIAKVAQAVDRRVPRIEPLQGALETMRGQAEPMPLADYRRALGLPAQDTWTRRRVVAQAQAFRQFHGRLPLARECHPDYGMPHYTQLQRALGSRPLRQLTHYVGES